MNDRRLITIVVWKLVATRLVRKRETKAANAALSYLNSP